MPSVVRFNNNSNLNGSVVATKAQSRAAYASAITFQRAINTGCLVIPQSKNQTTNTDASFVTEAAAGAQATTVAEQATILARACQGATGPV